MPFESSFKVSLKNLGSNPVPIWGVANVSDWSWDSRSMHFHANWHSEFPIHAYGARGTKDWNYIDIQGKGVYAGDNLAVMNPVKEWWGEGDEKIYVDGEKFPSHFGTGTEDYYGYAWCSNQRFTTAYVGQPLVSPRQNFGYTSLYRLHILDLIPFQRALRFDLEVAHWGPPVPVTYDAISFWYARPGAHARAAPPTRPASASRS